MSNRAAFDELELDGVPAALVVLGETLANEIDRVVGAGERVDPALVLRYHELLKGLVADGGDDDPIGDVLAKILDEAPTRKTKSG